MIKRRRFSADTKAKIVTRNNGVCARLGCSSIGPFEYDHIVPLEIGGKDSDENLQNLCIAHHKAKTKLDIKIIAKGRRIRRKADGTWRQGKKIGGRGFNKTLRRKINGKTVKRDGAPRMA